MKRGAIIGLGNIAVRGHLPAYLTDPLLRSSVEIVAVMDVVDQNREKSRELLPQAKFYTDLDQLLANERVEFADICAPPHTHAGFIEQCLRRKVHILCEKPLTQAASLVEPLVNAIREANVVFLPCHQYRYSPLWMSIRDIITSGALGKVTLAQFNVFRMHADSGTAAWNPEWRTDKSHSGGGILADTGTHYFYLTQFLFGVPRKISSVLKTLKHFNYPVEDTAIVVLEFEDKIVQLNLTWASGSRANSIWIAGTEGALSYDGTVLRQTSGGEMRDIPMPDVSDKRQYVEWYASLFREFIRRIDAADLRHDFLEEAATVMKMLEASYRGEQELAPLDAY